jgi:hypothetical protein
VGDRSRETAVEEVHSRSGRRTERRSGWHSKRRPGRGCVGWIVAVAGVALLCVGLAFTFFTRPDLAAQGADVLRAIFGDEAVAQMEMVLFQAQDTFQKAQYALGVIAPEPPWRSVVVTPQVTITSISIPRPTPICTAKAETAQTGSPASSSPEQTPAALSSEVEPSVTAETPGAADQSWQPAPLTPLGELEGEGQWSLYLQNAQGQPVAYRTFVQPDPTRPFAVVAVIVFDLQRTRLHYILGFEEPYSADGPKRSGAMPESDKSPNYLLAMFNGGFKATHGRFGAMADGAVALPPRDGLGTLAIYKDGRVRMGVWGSSLKPSDDMECWRQNGPLVIENGQINPRIYNNSPKDWGYTVIDVSPTWRSGVGISLDGERLFYFAGPSLTMEALARSMAAAGADQGMQLDINTYWVHFVAVRDQNDQRTLDPLFPAMMKDNINRYLFPYSRDFFYVTDVNKPTN